MLNDIFKQVNSLANQVNELVSGKPNAEQLIEFIEEVNIPLKFYQNENEKAHEDLLIKELRQGFKKVASQYSIGGYLGLKIDIEVGDGGVALELKLASELSKANNVQRLLGQVCYYVRRYNGEVVAVIIGTADERKLPLIRELGEVLKELGATYYFKTVTAGKKLK